jgi:hypothetical protein
VFQENERQRKEYKEEKNHEQEMRQEKITPDFIT